MRLVAAGLLIIAGALLSGLAEIAASLPGPNPRAFHNPSTPAREIGAIVQVVGFFMFACEYFADLFRKDKDKPGRGRSMD